MVITFRLCYHTEDMSAHADSTPTTTTATSFVFNPNATVFAFHVQPKKEEGVFTHDGYAEEGAFTHDGVPNLATVVMIPVIVIPYYDPENGMPNNIFPHQEIMEYYHNVPTQDGMSYLEEEDSSDAELNEICTMLEAQRDQGLAELADEIDKKDAAINSDEEEQSIHAPKEPTQVPAPETKEDVLRDLVKDGILTFNAGDNVQAPGYVTKLAKQLVAAGYKFPNPQVQKRFDDAKFENETATASCCKPSGATKPKSQKSGKKPCRFGKDCTNRKCPDAHHDDCPNWNHCMNRKCKKWHPLPCEFGEDCRFGDKCRFDHSGVKHPQ